MPDENPRVSIGMPVYNGARYLRLALESLLAQSFRDFELVISDNASTDETAVICMEFASLDSRIRYHRQPENLGASGNFNEVFKLSKAEYFTWAAADDLRHTTYLEKCVDLLDRCPNVLWCHSLSSHIGPDGELLTNPELQRVSYACLNEDGATQQGPSRTSSVPHERFEAVLLGHGGCIDSYGLMRADALRRTRLVLPYFGAEKVTMAEMALAGVYAEIPETLFFMRIHDAALGAAKTAAEQQATFTPKTKTHLIRLHLLAAYAQAIGRASLSFPESLRCFKVLGRYLLQFRKWSSVLRKAATGSGIGGNNSKMLESSKSALK